MQVTIQHKHTRGTSYHYNKDGPLIRAANEQHPDIKLINEFETICIDCEGTRYGICPEDAYTASTVLALLQKKISQIQVTLLAL